MMKSKTPTYSYSFRNYNSTDPSPTSQPCRILHYEIAFSLNMHAMNMKTSYKTAR